MTLTVNDQMYLGAGEAKSDTQKVCRMVVKWLDPSKLNVMYFMKVDKLPGAIVEKHNDR